MRDLEKAAIRGEPSYLWREGQERRLGMILEAAGVRSQGWVLDNGCGVGAYLKRLAQIGPRTFGLEFDEGRAIEASHHHPNTIRAAGEHLPFPTGIFDLILSHEVLEHTHDDRTAVEEIVRVMRLPDSASGMSGGRLVLFVPNRGYPFETHGVYLRGQYRFGNIPFINYFPRKLRNRMAPHVRVYEKRDLERLFVGLPVQIVKRSVIFGAYDTIIARWSSLGLALRSILHFLERTPLRVFGLSHFWIVQKT